MNLEPDGQDLLSKSEITRIKRRDKKRHTKMVVDNKGVIQQQLDLHYKRQKRQKELNK